MQNRPVEYLLDSQVLVLNRLWQPVGICTTRRALALLFVDHAQVVRIDEDNNFYTHNINSWAEYSEEFQGEEVLRSVSMKLRVPKIIVLQAYDRLPKKEVKFNRQNIFQRDGYKCQYCAIVYEAADLNLDHVIPRHKGGRTTWENVVCSCIRCNTKKGNKLPAEANMHPISEPRAPRWRPLFTSPRSARKTYDRSWRHFLDISNSKVTVSD